MSYGLPQTQYANIGDISIAYQVMGAGPLVCVLDGSDEMLPPDPPEADGDMVPLLPAEVFCMAEPLIASNGWSGDAACAGVPAAAG